MPTHRVRVGCRHVVRAFGTSIDRHEMRIEGATFLLIEMRDELCTIYCNTFTSIVYLALSTHAIVSNIHSIKSAFVKNVKWMVEHTYP